MPFIKVKLIDGAFDHAQKQQIVTRLVEAMDSIDGKNPPSATWVVIEEVKSGDLGEGAKNSFPAIFSPATFSAETFSAVARRPIDASPHASALADLTV